MEWCLPEAGSRRQRGMGSCLMGIEFRFCKMKTVLEIGYTMVWMFWALLNCTPKSDWGGRLYVTFILTTVKKINSQILQILCKICSVVYCIALVDKQTRSESSWLHRGWEQPALLCILQNRYCSTCVNVFISVQKKRIVGVEEREAQAYGLVWAETVAAALRGTCPGWLRGRYRRDQCSDQRTANTVRCCSQSTLRFSISTFWSFKLCYFIFSDFCQGSRYISFIAIY